MAVVIGFLVKFLTKILTFAVRDRTAFTANLFLTQQKELKFWVRQELYLLFLTICELTSPNQEKRTMPINLILGVLFFVIGFLLSYIGFILGSIDAFREDVAWGVIFWCIPYIGGILFYLKKWSNQKNRKSFFVILSGWLVTSLGGGLLKQASSSFQTSSISGADISYTQNHSTKSPDFSSIEFNISPSSTQESSPVSEPSPFPTEFTISANQEPSSPVSEPSPQGSPAPISTQKDDFTKSMKLGYAYYGQGDYQTALINFNRALQVRPSNIYAVKAVENTKSAIVQGRLK